jgi:hypothetical protein
VDSSSSSGEFQLSGCSANHFSAAGYRSQRARTDTCTLQLLTVPVYLAACAYVLVTAVYADRLSTRFPFLLAAQLLCLIGFAINRKYRLSTSLFPRQFIPPRRLRAFGADSLPLFPVTPAPAGVKFFGLILCAMGAYGGVPAMITWLTGNLSGQAKRGVGSALTLGLGSLGGVASSNM